MSQAEFTFEPNDLTSFIASPSCTAATVCGSRAMEGGGGCPLTHRHSEGFAAAYAPTTTPLHQ
jgi:hypothetical protein